MPYASENSSLVHFVSRQDLVSCMKFMTSCLAFYCIRSSFIMNGLLSFLQYKHIPPSWYPLSFTLHRLCRLNKKSCRMGVRIVRRRVNSSSKEKVLWEEWVVGVVRGKNIKLWLFVLTSHALYIIHFHDSRFYSFERMFVDTLVHPPPLVSLMTRSSIEIHHSIWILFLFKPTPYFLFQGLLLPSHILPWS